MLKSAFTNYINKTIPDDDSLLLTHKNVFIMPTRFGMLFLGLLAILFVLGTNYQNNPILLLCYFLLGVLFWALFQCFFNLHKTQFELTSCQDHFLGEQGTFLILISNRQSPPSQNRPMQLQLWHDKTRLLTEIIPGTDNQLRCHFSLPKRGRHTLPKLKIRSEFPFGLIQAWSYLRPSQQVWVYPKPQSGGWQFAEYEGNQDHSSEQQNTHQSENSERQFDGIRGYIPGSPMSQVAWKQYAKQQQGDYLLKDFVGENKHAVALTFASVRATDLETKLSVLTQACLDLQRDAVPFALNLEGFGGEPINIETGIGEQHVQHCLKTLASYAQGPI